MISVKPTDADFVAAMCRDRLNGAQAWAKLKREATQLAAERLAKDVLTEVERLTTQCDSLDTAKGAEFAEYLEIQDRITALFAKHDRMMDVAFPRESVK